jgi:hypothetical protein
MEVGTSRGPALEILVAECNVPQYLVCVEDDCPRSVVLWSRPEYPRPDLRVGLLTVVRILGNDVTCALLHEDPQCALEEQTVMTRLEMNDDAQGRIMHQLFLNYEEQCYANQLTSFWPLNRCHFLELLL